MSSEEYVVEVRGKQYSKGDLEIIKNDHLYHRKMMHLQGTLISKSNVQARELLECCRQFQPYHLDEIAQERGLLKKCGYPLCNKETRKKSGAKSFDIRTGRILDTDTLNRFCSIDCHDRLELLKVQLPVSNPKAKIEIPLLNQKTDSSVSKAPSHTLTQQDLATIEAAKESRANAINAISPTTEDINQAMSEMTIKETPCVSNPGVIAAEPHDMDPTAVEGYNTKTTEERNAIIQKIQEKRKAKQSQEISQNETVADTEVMGVEKTNAPNNKHVQFVTPATEYIDELDNETTSFASNNDEENDENDDSNAEEENESNLDGVSDDDEDLGWLDFSDLHASLQQVTMTPLMKIANAIYQWREPIVNPNEDDMVILERRNIVNTSLAKALNITLLALQLPWLEKRTALGMVTEQTGKFNFCRPSPAFSSCDYEVLCLLLLNVSLVRQNDTSEKQIAELLELSCKRVANQQHRKCLSVEEFKSLLNIAENMI